jgi:AcrR family transcriptional regulator
MNKRKYEFALELNREMQTAKFSKVFISDICDNMKCSRQSFYYYFNTIEDCLSYFVRESFKNQIHEDYMISDVFNYFDNNAKFVAICNSDDASKTIFWDSLYQYVKKVLDFIYSKNIVEYLALYAEQKDAITSFYVAGLLEKAKLYVQNNHLPTKEKCITYCKAILGTADDMRNTVLRFNR